MIKPKRKTPPTKKPAKKTPPKKAVKTPAKRAPTLPTAPTAPAPPPIRVLDRVSLARRLCECPEGGVPVLVSVHGLPKELRPRLYEGGALWPEDFPKSMLLEMAERNPRVFANQQMGFSSQVKGNIFKREWWGGFTREELNTARFIALMQMWDTAQTENDTSDWSVGLTGGLTDDGRVFLLSRMKGRWAGPKLLVKVPEFYYSDLLPLAAMQGCEHMVGAEDMGSGKTMLQFLNSETMIPIMPVKNPFRKGGAEAEDSAKARLALSVGAPLVRTGRVLLPAFLEGESDWTVDFIEQMADFPNGKHDDDPDAFDLLMLKLCDAKAGVIAQMLTSAPYLSIAASEFMSGKKEHAPGAPVKRIEEDVQDVEFECALTTGEDLEDIGEIGY